MALIHCPECGREVSSYAPQCPNCGFPVSSMANSTPAEDVAEGTRVNDTIIAHASEPTQIHEQSAPAAPSFEPVVGAEPAPAVAPQRDSETVVEATPVEAPVQPAVEYPKLKGSNNLLGGNILHGLMLLGAALHILVSFYTTMNFGSLVYSEREKGLDDEILGPWLMVLYAALSAALLVAVIRRNHSMTISLSIGTLIAAIMVHSGTYELIEGVSLWLPLPKDVFEMIQTLSIFGIITTGVGAVIGKLLLRNDSEGVENPITDWSTSILPALLFALLFSIPYIYPEWEGKYNGEYSYLYDESGEYNDWLFIDIAFLASIVGIAGVACKRYKVSLMAALFALVTIPIALITKYSFGDAQHVKNLDISLTTPAIFAIIVVVALVITLIAICNKGEKESWGSSIAVLPILVAIILGWCSSLECDGSYTIHRSILSFPNDATLYLQIATFATAFLVVCRQYIAAVITSPLAIVLSLVIINLADDVESGKIAYGFVLSMVVTSVIVIYNAAKNREEVRLDVIVATLAVVTIMFALIGINFAGINYAILLTPWSLMPLSLMLIYSMRRNTLAAICITCALLYLQNYIIDESFGKLPDDGLIGGLLLLKNCALVLLVIAVLYWPLKRFIRI